MDREKRQNIFKQSSHEISPRHGGEFAHVLGLDTVDEGIVIGAVAEALGLYTGASAYIFLTRHVLVCF